MHRITKMALIFICVISFGFSTQLFAHTFTFNDPKHLSWLRSLPVRLYPVGKPQQLLSAPADGFVTYYEDNNDGPIQFRIPARIGCGEAGCAVLTFYDGSLATGQNVTCSLEGGELGISDILCSIN